MARRPNTVDGGRVNGDGLPPSTLAAQMVQNQSRTIAKQKSGDEATFVTLLRNILQETAAMQETDVHVNAQLIHVVSQVGLTPLNVDPFTNKEVVADSLRVIDLTVSRQPEVLFTAVEPEGPPLVLGLVATLVDLLGRNEAQHLNTDVVLQSMIEALAASTDLWPRVRDLEGILQDCIKDAIAAFETSTKTPFVVSVEVPSARNIANLWPQITNKIAMPQGIRTILRDPATLFVVVAKLALMRSTTQKLQHDSALRLSRLLPRMKHRLEIACVWKKTIDYLLLLPHSVTTAVFLVNQRPILSLEADTQQILSKYLMEGLNDKLACNKTSLIFALHDLSSNDRFTLLHEDLKIAVTAWLCRFQSERVLSSEVASLRDALHSDSLMTDSNLHRSFMKLSVPESCDFASRRRRKRRRIEGINADKTMVPGSIPPANEILNDGGHELNVRDKLDSLPNTYKAMDEDERIACWQSLAAVPQHDHFGVQETTLQLLNLPEVHQGKRSRVSALLAVRAHASQSTDPAMLDLRNGSYGKFCMMALHSSIRDLRIAAAVTLPAFLREDLSEPLRGENRQVALEYLRTLSDRDTPSEQETLIMAWGQVAVLCGEAELNLTLLRLVEYLGHRNALVCAFAATEIETIANAKRLTVSDLFQPFWRSIAVAVVRDLISKPQKAQRLVELLSVEMDDFLKSTQIYTLPSLILTKNRDVLQRLALIYGEDYGIQDILLMRPRTNLAAVLAALLTQPGPDTEERAVQCLREVAPALSFSDLSGLMRDDPDLFAAEMLKHCGQEPEDRKKDAHRAFLLFANIVDRTPGQRPSHPKSTRVIGGVIERLILGILVQYSQALESAQQPVSEKIRCLRGIAEMVILANGQVSLALPQIRACLRYGLEHDKLREVAFHAWLSILPVLPPDDIAHMAAETFALIMQHWRTVSYELQQEMYSSVADLVKMHNDKLQENIMTLPSLDGIQLFAKFAAEFKRLKGLENTENHFKAYSARLRSDSDAVVIQALKEAVPFLEAQQRFLHDHATSENPAPSVLDFLRALLDVTVKYASDQAHLAELCGRALGIVGCLDSNRVEFGRKKRQTIVLSNFEKASEVIDWVVTCLEDVLVDAFKSEPNTRSQGITAFVIQELLKFCNFSGLTMLRLRASQEPAANQRWLDMPEHVRITLTPLLTSKYVLTRVTDLKPSTREYPDFKLTTAHSEWLRSLTYDMMFKALSDDNTKLLFPLLARVVKMNESIAIFVLPYASLNIVLGGTDNEVKGLKKEFLAVLTAEPVGPAQWETTRLCSETVFAMLDYMTSWLREKRLDMIRKQTAAYKSGISPDPAAESSGLKQIESVETFLKSIPAVTIAVRAMKCRSDARALFHWEQHIRQKRSIVPEDRLSDEDQETYTRLLEIYAQIDEPDGLEGISAHLTVLSEEQRAVNHSKAGRWTAAQAWYEVQLAAEPEKESLQSNMLRCLKETGQYASLLKYLDSFDRTEKTSLSHKHLSLAVESCLMTETLSDLKKYVSSQDLDSGANFSVGMGKLLLKASVTASPDLLQSIQDLRQSVAKSISVGATDTLQKCHDKLAQLHVVYELESLMLTDKPHSAHLLQTFTHRLAAIGSFTQNKQYVLGVRRVIMKLRPQVFEREQIGGLWMITAKLARQANNTAAAYSAVQKAYECGERGAKLEEARLLWHDGHQREAITLLDSSLSSGLFDVLNDSSHLRSASTNDGLDLVHGTKQNLVIAKALLLLAKWLDASGQSQTKDMTERYQLAAKKYQRWEKGHYYLGKHYSKLLDAQKALPKERRTHSFESGELARLVIDNTLRSIPFGNKYWHETIPRILTLWLGLGTDCLKKEPKEDANTFEKRVKSLQMCNRQLTKYFDRVSPYVFYPSLSQLISRIAHQHPDVWKQLSNILYRIVSTHPSEALWNLFPVVKSRDANRVSRGSEILNRLKDPKNKSAKSDVNPNINLASIITSGQRLCDGLLYASETPVEPRGNHFKLGRDLGFNHKLAPCQLVVPIEATLTASSPSMTDVETIRKHKAFAQEKITITSFADDVLVLSSLQRPRKLIARGSDGKKYGLLCKPKDDLRKDQRLMEFNNIINRALKRDNKSSKRQLYIKTYAVTPLSEESGIIEWVEGIKPIRDVLLSIYSRKGIRPDYGAIRKDLDEACKGPDRIHIFADKVLSIFPASMHEWFAETYPDPDVWFAARLRYARSAAVMSMTGHMLGLGDRHGENILLEESTGGVFHVDFNCLFDKGLTFEKPELVPFRLTHNMQDAMGPYGFEGPFRTSSELTMGLLRQERDTLMTVLETFLYDPTTDFVGKPKKRSLVGVPETPQEILDSVATKLKGLLRGEHVPLSVEGYVDALIQQATSHANLAGMYIGWCSFL